MPAAEDAKPAEEAPAGFLSGLPIPVDPEQIERELSRMWKPADSEAGAETGPVTRACLSNLVVDLPGAAAGPRARDMLLDVGRRFPSRMIVLLRRPGGAPRLSAWVTAVCHRPAPSSPPICCEQILLESTGDRLDLLRGAVLPLLAPDVPVILALSGVEGKPIAAILGEVADRAVFDSRLASPSDLSIISETLEGRPSLAADDLAWRATAGIRWAISDIFDDPAARHLLEEIRSVEVRYAPLPGGAPGGAAAAALFAGWLLSRLGWRFESRVEAPGGLGAVLVKDGRSVRAILRAGADPAALPGDLTSLRMESATDGRQGHLEASRAAGLLRIEAVAAGSCVIPRTMALRARVDADLLGEALERTTPQGIFRAAVELARRMG